MRTILKRTTTAQSCTLVELNPVNVDQRFVCERKWNEPFKPAKPQLPADIGLFSNDADQLDLVQWLTEQSEE